MQQLAQTNPQILQLINEHQDEFLRLLQEPVDPSALGGMPGGPGAPGVIQVTPAEKEAIDRVRRVLPPLRPLQLIALSFVALQLGFRSTASY